MTEDGPREFAQFADRLNRLRQRAGSPSLSRLAALTADLPQPLARSTISDKLTAKSLPDWDFVASYLAACAAYAEQSGAPLPADAVDAAQWDAAHLRMLRAVDRSRSVERLAAAARAQLGRRRATPAPDRADEAGSPLVPRQLPAALRHFAGRAAAIRVLDGLLGEALAGATVVISAINGTAGIGKTALAVHWAHRVAERFPDGQLYVNLRGFDPSGAPMSPTEAVRGFLDALGVSPRRVPATVQAQAALYRSVLAGRRMLVVLDNARDAEQVRPLLPGAPGCLVLVTSRSELSDLVAAQDAHPVTLDLLSDTEAHEMLARRLGAGRVSAEPDAIEEIIALCARLPLALAVVAVRAATRPGFPLIELAGELRAAQGGLSAFAGGPPATDVRAVFSWSYRRLTAGTADLFRLLGLHPGPDLGVPAAAALAGTTVQRVRAQLRDLARANLVVESVPHRYALHDLLRAYATELANGHDGEADRRAALRRMLDHYLHTGTHASRLLDPHHDQIELDPPATGAAPEDLTGHDHGVAWLTAEHGVMPALVPHATAAGFHTHAWQLALVAGDFLYMSDRWQEMIATYRAGLEAARSLGDKDVQARLHNGIGTAYARIGRYGEAEVNKRHALELFGPLGDPVGRAHTHRTFVWLAEKQGRPGEALHHAERALSLYREAGHRVGYARMLNNLGWIRTQLGDLEAAVDLCRQALTVQQEIGDSSSEAHTWDSLGHAHHRLGQHVEAVACYRRATALFRQTTGVPREAASTLTRLGDVHLDAGDPSAARDAWRRAVEILDRLGDAGAHRIRVKLDRVEHHHGSLDRRHRRTSSTRWADA